MTERSEGMPGARAPASRTAMGSRGRSPRAEMTERTDPVLVKRARIAAMVKLAKRGGYGLYLLASILFVVGFVVGFTEPLTTAIIAGLGVGSVLLAPAIVFGFAVNAADRDDAERGLSP